MSVRLNVQYHEKYDYKIVATRYSLFYQSSGMISMHSRVSNQTNMTSCNGTQCFDFYFQLIAHFASTEAAVVKEVAPPSVLVVTRAILGISVNKVCEHERCVCVWGGGALTANAFLFIWTKSFHHFDRDIDVSKYI